MQFSTNEITKSFTHLHCLSGILPTGLPLYLGGGIFMTSKNCLNCHKEFYYHKSREKQGDVKYCSVKCSRQKMIGENHHSWRGGLKTVKCKICSKEIELKNKDVLITGNYCSRKCVSVTIIKTIKQKSLNNKVKKYCIVCGTLRLIKPSHQNTEGKYCSNNCKNQDYKIRFKGNKNPNFKHSLYEGKSYGFIRKINMIAAIKKGSHTLIQWNELKKQYGFQCAKCKKQEPNIKLTKDHIKPVSRGGDNGIKNIQPLCQKCNVKKFTRTIRFNHQLKLM